VARSWLLVPAGRDDDIAAADASAAAVVVLDIEDGVGDHHKEAARSTAARRMQT
jgi:citrate lyase beta subunit